jgi:transposase, IS5 family
VRVLTIQASGTESLWDEILPAEVKALPGDLARLDRLLADPCLLAPVSLRWERLLAEAGASLGRGRPTIAMESYVRLMIVKHRSGWGYETLMREVSDSLHLRRSAGSG